MYTIAYCTALFLILFCVLRCTRTRIINPRSSAYLIINGTPVKLHETVTDVGIHCGTVDLAKYFRELSAHERTHLFSIIFRDDYSRADGGTFVVQSNSQPQSPLRPVDSIPLPGLESLIITFKRGELQ